MKPYSIDLRERVVAACDQDEQSYQAIGRQFSVSPSFIGKLLRRRHATGSVAAKAHGGGPQPKLQPENLEQLKALVHQQPDATLEELRKSLAERHQLHVSCPTLSRALKKLNLPLKKKFCTPANGTRPGCRASAATTASRSRRWS